MKGTIQAAVSRLAEYGRAHPGCRIYQVEGNHYAWKPDPGGDGLSGELTHGRTEDELLAKLAAAPG